MAQLNTQQEFEQVMRDCRDNAIAQLIRSLDKQL